MDLLRRDETLRVCYEMIPHNMEGQEKLSIVSESHRQKLDLEQFPRSQGLGFPIIATW